MRVARFRDATASLTATLSLRRLPESWELGRPVLSLPNEFLWSVSVAKTNEKIGPKRRLPRFALASIVRPAKTFHR
jgi:hypothetical protein